MYSLYSPTIATTAAISVNKRAHAASSAGAEIIASTNSIDDLSRDMSSRNKLYYRFVSHNTASITAPLYHI